METEQAARQGLTLYPVAEVGGALAWAVDLARDGIRPADARCVGCQGPVLLKAGEKRRPHFAHQAGASCTASETVLHSTTVRVLAASLLEASVARRPFDLFMTCSHCRADRTGDLALHTGLTVETDRVLEQRIRPDLTVRSTTGKLLYVIEVVVTHAPETAALSLYEALDVPVVVIRPSWETLPQIRRGLAKSLLRPDGGDGTYEVLGRCRFPRHSSPEPAHCPECPEPALRLQAEVSTTPCWKCKSDVRVLDLYDTAGDQRRLVAASAPELLGVKAVAKERDVVLQWRHSAQAGGSYLMHLCGRCRAPQGDNFLYLTDDCATTDEVVHEHLVCRAGRWTSGLRRRWGPGSIRRRPTAALGVVGEPSGLFGTGPSLRSSDSLVSVQQVNARSIGRRMLGGGW